MTNNLIALPLPDLARIAFDAYYRDDFLTRDSIIAYCDSTPTDDDSLPLRDRLIAALDFDIHDLLHNANLSDLIPDTDSLPDAEYDALNDRLDNRDFCIALADLILA